MDNEQQQPKKSGCLSYLFIAVAISFLLFYCDSKPTVKPTSSSDETPSSQTTSPQITIEPPSTDEAPGESKGWELFSENGSANALNGTNLIVSVFVSDPDYSWQWDVNDYADNNLAYHSLNNLSIACSWITQEASRYGANPVFYYDWSEYPDLYYEANLSVRMTSQNWGDIYQATTNYINTTIDSDALMRKYGAGNVVYLLFVNTPPGYEINSGSFNLNDGSAPYPYEFCTMFIHEGDYELWPAAIAHEILHCYGAHDLYMVTSSAITQEYVDYQENSKTNDIMRVTFDPDTSEVYYDRIVNELSELDAYYVGLTSTNADVDAWSLGKRGIQQ